MDITYVSNRKKFNYRVCAIIISNNKILAMHDERSPYFYLPGGRVQMGETAEHAVVREVEEELNITPKIIRPLWLNQSFFTEDVDKLNYHEICIYSPVSVRIFGAILSVAGTAIFIVAVWTMRDSWRAGVSKTDKTELVTNGIYQISRNPAFLGFDLLYIGTLLMFFNWILCFLTVFAVIMYHLQIVNVEEDFLFATFGNEYLQYKKKVCRYIGRKR